jgi:hypothetical protein
MRRPIKPDPKYKVIPSTRHPIKPDLDSRVNSSMRRPIKSDPQPQVNSSMRRQIKPDSESQVNSSMRRPAPARSSLVQAFRQILAQQNDAEYITLSSGEEDDNYY